MFAPEPCAIGTGNSPPARKLASLPLSATRFGSARLWNSPRFCSALITTPRSYFWLKQNTFRKSLNVNLPSALVTSAPKSLLGLRPRQVGEPRRGELLRRDAADRVLDTRSGW